MKVDAVLYLALRTGHNFSELLLQGQLLHQWVLNSFQELNELICVDIAPRVGIKPVENLSHCIFGSI